MSKIKDFTLAEAWLLPIVELADVSGSMGTNGNIESLNDAIKAMSESLAEKDPSRAETQVDGGGDGHHHTSQDEFSRHLQYGSRRAPSGD